MKKLLFCFIFIIFSPFGFLYSQDTESNDFYDNDTIYKLGNPVIEILGEISNPGKVDFTKLPLRSEIVKETVLNEKGDTAFIGAFRYDGYSLYDILNSYTIQKKNMDEYNLITDLYVEVENANGEKVHISWGEIYYPVNRHKIIIATSVMRIIPSKSKDMWELPKAYKLVVATDFLTERNIYRPSKITVKSYARSYTVTRHMENMYSAEVNIFKNEQKVETFTNYPDAYEKLQLSTVFYGRGRGLHRIGKNAGVPLKNIIETYLKINNSNIKNTLVIVAAKDGYRSVFTLSEICNRNDFHEILLTDRSDDKKNGAYAVLITPDFFSDRAVKAITEIRIVQY